MVGLEIPAAAQTALDAFLGSDGTPEDVEALLSAPERQFWRRDFQDGSSSSAYWKVIAVEQDDSLRTAAFYFDQDNPPHPRPLRPPRHHPDPQPSRSLPLA